MRTTFYFLLFIFFLERLPYLKLISYILLSYFCYINVDSRGLKFCHATNTVSKNAVLWHCILGFKYVCHNRRKEKKIDFGVSLLEVILLVLVAFMEFIYINEVVIIINIIRYYYCYFECLRHGKIRNTIYSDLPLASARINVTSVSVRRICNMFLPAMKN